MTRVRWLGALVAAALLVGACSTSGGSTTTAGPAPAPAAVAVTIDNFAFSPASVTVPVGTTVTWTNMQNVSHTVTADDGAFDSGSMATGATFSQVFDTPGTFAYHCEIHPNMMATVTVEG